MLTGLGRWFVVFAFALVVAACGGSGLGPAPAHPAVAAKACPFYPVQHALQSCHSTGGSGWVVSLRYHQGPCTLFFSRGGKRAWTYRGRESCTQETWVEPDLLLVEGDYSVVRIDPSTHAATQISGLGDFVVSPNGLWIAGDNGSEPQNVTNVFVVSVRDRKCLVVPHSAGQTDTSAAGFEPDSKSIVVQRNAFKPDSGPVGRGQLVQLPLSSLQTGCPSDIARRFVLH